MSISKDDLKNALQSSETGHARLQSMVEPALSNPNVPAEVRAKLQADYNDYATQYAKVRYDISVLTGQWWPSSDDLESAEAILRAAERRRPGITQQASGILSALGTPVPAPVAEVAAAPSGTVAKVQQALNSMRVPPPNAPLLVDNRLGTQTRKALQWFQSGHGLQQTGMADAATLSALSVHGEGHMGFDFVTYGAAVATVPALQAALHAWKRYRGTHAPTVAAVPGVPSSAAAAAAVHGAFGIDVFSDLSHDPSSVARTQQQLNMLGWRLSIDGGLGPKTGQAIASFQQTHGMKPTGRLDVVTSSLIDMAATTGQAPTFSFEWLPYALGVATLPALSVVRQTVHNYTGGGAHMRGEEDDVGFEWIPYMLGVATLPAASAIRQYVHSATGGAPSRMYGEDNVLEPWEMTPQPWELESTEAQDILYGDTMMSLPADNLGRVRF